MQAPDNAARPAAASVQIEGVDLHYGATHVLRDVNLEVRPGELFAFLGPSGCGKTTLLRLIAGFAHADRGRVRVGGEDITALPPWQRDIGLVFQSYALWPHMSVRRNVAFGLEQRRLPRAQIEQRVDEALALVGLSGHGARRPAQLSGGQQQRVALARTIAVRPRVLLLDEPLSNLDAQLRVQVRRELRDLQRRLGMTTIFVTHDQEEANTMADRIAVLRDGTVQQVGSPIDLYERPGNLFVAGFLGTANLVPGRLVDGAGGRRYLLGSGQHVAVPPSAPPQATLLFRPQDAVLLPAGTAAAAAPGDAALLAGEVVRREFLGATIRYGVRLDRMAGAGTADAIDSTDGAAPVEVIVDDAFRGRQQLLEPGGRVQLAIAAGALQWLA